MNRDWRGISVLILSTGITVSLVIAALSSLIQKEPAPQWLAYLIFTLFGAVIGVVASYVRHEEEKVHPKHDRNEPPH